VITPSPEIRISDKWVHIYVDLDWRIKVGHLKPLGRIDIDEAAKEWGVPGEIVGMAVSLLVAEGRVRRCLNCGYIVAPQAP
jgi:DNA-binding GntR family transcriptional regulator